MSEARIRKILKDAGAILNMGAKLSGQEIQIPVDKISANYNFSRQGRDHSREDIDAMKTALLADGQIDAGEVGVDVETGKINLHRGNRRLVAWREIQTESGRPAYFLAKVKIGNQEQAEDRNWAENWGVRPTAMQFAQVLLRLKEERHMSVKGEVDPKSKKILEPGLVHWLADRGTPRNPDWIHKTLRLNNLIQPLQDALHDGMKGFKRTKAQVVCEWDAKRQREFWQELKIGKKPDAAPKKTKRPSVKARKALADELNDALTPLDHQLSWISAFMDVVNGEATDRDAVEEIPPAVCAVLLKHATPVYLEPEKDERQTTIPETESE